MGFWTVTTAEDSSLSRLNVMTRATGEGTTDTAGATAGRICGGGTGEMTPLSRIRIMAPMPSHPATTNQSQGLNRSQARRITLRRQRSTA